MDKPTIRGLSHVSISVRDLDRSLAFYRDTLLLPVLQPVRDGVAFEGRQAMVLVGRTGLSLQEHGDGAADGFDPRRAGLDHLAFDVGGRDELGRWASRLDATGVTHSGEKEVAGWGHMIELRDPDGIQLELFVLGAAAGS